MALSSSAHMAKAQMKNTNAGIQNAISPSHAKGPVLNKVMMPAGRNRITTQIFAAGRKLSVGGCGNARHSARPISSLRISFDPP